MPTTTPIYYPAITDIVKVDNLPEFLSFIKTGIENTLNKVYYKDYYFSKNISGSEAFYSLTIVSKTKIAIEFPGTEIYLVLNPDFKDGDVSSFPITLFWHWELLRYIKNFNIGEFSFSLEHFFNLALQMFGVSEATALEIAVNTFVIPESESVSNFSQLVNDINTLYGSSIVIDEFSENRYEDLITAVKVINKEVFPTLFGLYIVSNDNIEEGKQKLNTFFSAFIPYDLEAYVKEILIPKIRATLKLSAAIEFPRKILTPYNEQNGALSVDTDVNVKTKFLFAEADFYADTEEGIGYKMDVAGTLIPTFSEITNTGLLIQIERLKLDLSKTKNIPEADAAGYPIDFMGVYADAISVTLPPKWFSKDESASSVQSTLRIGGYNLLVGSGGVTGTFALESVPIISATGSSFYSDQFEFQYPIAGIKIDTQTKETILEEIKTKEELNTYINSLEDKNQYRFKFPLTIVKKNPAGEEKTFNNQDEFRTYINSFAIGDNDYLWLRLGQKDKTENEKKSWRIGFKQFDISLYHGQVTSSHLHARLEFKKFKDAQGSTALVDFYGEWYSSEDFRLSANFINEPQRLNLFDSLYIDLQTAEVGKQDDKFFVGADTIINFPEGTLAHKLFKGKSIDLPAIRIYSNGRFEVVGGVSKIPVSFEMNLGPAKMNVTALHLGTVQLEHNGKMRTYNFIGFDGGINVNPGGLDVKGDGVKYYYTVDNDDLGLESHSFFHISTLEVEITIPGGATEDEAEVLIKGSLTIPDPGESPEYAGKIGLKIKELGINGEVSMRYAPKYPAYMVAAKIGLNKAIPLGPISLTAFSGLIGYRYVAEKEAIGMTSKDTWYDYYTAPERGINERKFSGPERTKGYDFPFSLGIGATFEATAAPKLVSMRAMVLLSLPSMFAVDAGLNILSKRLGLAETDESEANFYAFIIFGDNSLEFGAGADYRLNKNGWFIDLHADMQAGFFFKNQRPWYINFGTKEKPISAVLFKDFLNLRSQAFLMISGKGIEAGARAEFKLNLGKYAKAWAIVEVGGKISFEKPQVGGYLYLEGGIDINIRFIRITAVLSVYLSVELIKPFKIFAQLKFTFKIKFFFTFKINVKLTLKWEKSNEVDRTPIPAITFNQPSNDIDYYKPATHLEAVKGVHMMTQEVFDIDYIPIVSPNIKTDEEQVSDYFNRKLDEIKVIPLDTYIDFKSEKALFPSKNLDAKIGGHTGIAADFIELIPPEKTVKGGHTIRQVKHKYIIEDIEIKALTTNGWVDYHPFKALSPNSNIADVDLTKLKIGHWQRKNERYDSIRLLASNPFSFLEGGGPSWFIPEQYGITPSELFCQSEFTREHLSNFENITTGTTYYPPAHYPAHFINGAYYNIKGDYYQSFEMDEDGNIKEVVSEDVMKIEFPPNNNVKSLKFSNANTLVITLPQDSVWVELELNSYISEVRIECKKLIINDSSGNIENEILILPNKTIYTKADILNNKIVIESPKNTNGEYDLSKAFSIIEITPQSSSLAIIESIKAKMNAIVEYAELHTDGEIIGADFDRYQELEDQLNNLKKDICANTNLEQSIVGKLSFKTAGCSELNKIVQFDGYNNKYNKGVILINDQQTLNSLYYSFTHDSLGAPVNGVNAPIINFAVNSVLVLTVNTYSSLQNVNVSANIKKIVQKDNTISVCYEYITIGGNEINSNRAIVILTDKISNDKLLLENQNCDCYSCRELTPTKIEEGFIITTFPKILLINSLEQYNSIHSIYSDPHNSIVTNPFDLNTLFNDHSVILINNTLPSLGVKNPIDFKCVERGDSISLCYSSGQETTNSKYLFLVIDKISNEKPFVLNQNCSCTEVNPPVDTCKNLQFKNLIFSIDSVQENPLNKVINNQQEFNSYYTGITVPTIDFNSKSVILINFGKQIIGEPKYYVNKVVKTNNKVSICYTSIGNCNNINKKLASETYPYILLETEKLSDNFTVEITTSCNCQDTNYIVYNICDFSDIIYEELLNSLSYNVNDLFEDNKIHFIEFLQKLAAYDELTYGLYAIVDGLELDFNTWEYSNGSTLEEALIFIKGLVNWMKLQGCCIKDESQYSCHTYLQYVKWKTLEDYEYNITIPGIDAVKEDNMQAIDAQTKIVQPIWRPNTKYYIKFKVRDEVDNSKDPNSGIFNYYYGFRTVGPVGHFHKKNPNYLQGKKPEEFTITSLAPYIDYRRSYPNADGNILNAKPLFFGNEQCKINIYFDRPFAYHMLKKWEKYGDLPEYKGAMNIVVKDPVSEEIIPYPLPEVLIDLGEIPRPLDDGNWKDDNDPRMPLQIKILKNYIDALNSSGAVKCSGEYGDPIPPIKPKSYSYEVKLTNLKPSKLYTAMVYNAFDDNADNEFNAQVDSSGNIIYEENQLVHQYVFATSRYANFRNQVMSYWLENKDENGVVISRKQAVFNIDLDLTDSQVNNAYTLVSGSSNAQIDILAKQYIDEFDRVLEGVLGIKPLDPPTCTDFVIIKNNNGEVIAILVRNPEPFNDPKISREDIADTIQVIRNGTENIKFKKLFSKDYSQVLIMHKTKVIEEKSLVFKFLYKTWNPENREYEINITDTNSTVVTDSIIINN